MTKPDGILSAVADAYRREWPFVVAATVRVARDLDLAEAKVQEDCADALRRWSRDGVPTNPAAWVSIAA